MKDNYDFSTLKNIRRNPFAEQLKKNGHSTIIHYTPADIDSISDDEMDYSEHSNILENGLRKKKAN